MSAQFMDLFLLFCKPLLYYMRHTDSVCVQATHFLKIIYSVDWTAIKEKVTIHEFVTTDLSGLMFTDLQNTHELPYPTAYSQL